MKYIHHIHILKKNKQVGRQIEVIEGKSRFKKWVIEYYKKGGQDICFRLSTWKEVYLGIVVYPKTRGKNKGELTVGFYHLNEESSNFTYLDI